MAAREATTPTASIETDDGAVAWDFRLLEPDEIWITTKGNPESEVSNLLFQRKKQSNVIPGGRPPEMSGVGEAVEHRRSTH